MPTDEFQLIQEIKKTLGRPSRNVLLGIGDDAAVMESPRGKLVATTDSLVEGVHFDLTYTAPRELGFKALAVNLSDLAAMGAKPLYALVTLGLKQETSDHFVAELYEGMRDLARKYAVDIVGGNLVQSPQAILVDVVALGESKKKYFTRSGAKPGDLIVVTGFLGTSAAALTGIRRLGRQGLGDRAALLRAHLQPEPRLKESAKLLELGGVSSMIDISDGLAREIHHLADASKVGMLIEEEKVPLSKQTLEIAELIQSNPRLWALYGGEDYELLFTVSKTQWKKYAPKLKSLKTPFTVIGEVRARAEGRRIRTLAGATILLESRGWNHFVRRRKTPFNFD